LNLSDPIYNDIYELINALKHKYRRYYLISLFVNKNFFYPIILLLYIDLEIKNLIFNKSDRNIIMAKFSWWRSCLLLTNDNKTPSVPFFRCFSFMIKTNIFEFDDFIKLIDLAENTYTDNKKIFLIKYLILRSKILKKLLNINLKNNSHKKSLNLAIIAECLKLNNENVLSTKALAKAKKYNKRPLRNDLFIFLIHSNLNSNESGLLKQIFYGVFRYW